MFQIIIINYHEKLVVSETCAYIYNHTYIHIQYVCLRSNIFTIYVVRTQSMKTFHFVSRFHLTDI